MGVEFPKTTILNFHFILVVFRPLGNAVRDQDAGKPGWASIVISEKNL
jgi:hypothetical protein